MDDVLSDVMSGACKPPFPSLGPDASYRLDEGYSEDTRSLDDGDSAMGLEPRTSSEANLLDTLQNAVLSLDERQRSGSFKPYHKLSKYIPTDEYYRARLSGSSYLAHIVYRSYC